MPSVRTLVGRVFVVEWDGVGGGRSPAAAARDMEEAKRVRADWHAAFDRAREPLVYLGIVSVEGAPSPAAFRAALPELGRGRVATCAGAYLVIEGSSPEHVEERAGAATTMRAEGVPVVVAKTVAELMRLAGRQVRDELKAAIQVAKEGTRAPSSRFRVAQPSGEWPERRRSEP
jgi:hypothetical protein